MRTTTRTMDGGGGGKSLLLLLLVLMVLESFLVATVQGLIVCDCLTPECQDEGRSTCTATHYCYSENVQGMLTRGCIDDSSPLLCENRKPQGRGIDYWPALFCCNDRDFCNRDVTPTIPVQTDDKLSNEAVPVDSQPELPTYDGPEPQDTADTDLGAGRGGGGGGGSDGGGDGGGGGGGKYRGRLDPYDAQYPLPPCQNGDDASAQRGSSRNNNNNNSNNNNNNGSSKVVNPIYIAVPVAGVCVMLALVIFGMYLLRRRQHHHHFDNYHHYHDHLHHPLHPPPHLKQTHSGAGGQGQPPGGGGSSGSVGVPMYQHHVHCDCMCKKALPPCGGKVNRCTDSERSSSGSETKLFLQA